MFKMRRFVLLAVLLPLTIATASGSAYDPAWSSLTPMRVVRIAAATGADEISNGQRLWQAVESLTPGDRLEVGSGTYSIQRLWDVTISGTPQAPIWIVAAEGARVKSTRPDAQQNVLNVGHNKEVQYVVLSGLEFTGGSHGISSNAISATAVAIVRCKFKEKRLFATIC